MVERSANGGSAVSERSGTSERRGTRISDFEDNQDFCSLCNSKIGKRFMNLRHHCRICGKCVCGSCSPSSIQLEDHKTPQRACTPCATAMMKALAMEERVLDVSRQLCDMAGGRSMLDLTDTAGPEGSLEETVSVCEATLAPLAADRARLYSAVEAEKQQVACLAEELTKSNQQHATEVARLTEERRRLEEQIKLALEEQQDSHAKIKLALEEQILELKQQHAAEIAKLTEERRATTPTFPSRNSSTIGKPPGSPNGREKPATAATATAQAASPPSRWLCRSARLNGT